MNYEELLTKYCFLLEEVNRLSSENNRLKARLEEVQSDMSFCKDDSFLEQSLFEIAQKKDSSCNLINNNSDPATKIHLFMSLFKGRDDVYAVRWENTKKSISGYSPVCKNQWCPGICRKPAIPCSKCENKSYAQLNENIIEDHLRGNIIAGIYPMMSDESCYFLAMDFDEADWKEDITTVRNICAEFSVPVAAERSKSGNGAHLWFFFEDKISASLARRFGTALLTAAMDRRHEIKFKSYDRLFPSQDTLPKGGLGNLIALPFQKAARDSHNSEFIDEKYNAFSDQWSFLASVKKITEINLLSIIDKLCIGPELGELKVDEEDESKPWEKTIKIKLSRLDFPDKIEIVKSNMLFVPKKNITEKGLNHLKRIASFKNPVFYRHQAMRLSTYRIPRIISCADETKEYLCLPRGCETDIINDLESLGVIILFIDKTNHGKKINVEFTGQLRDEQPSALRQLLSHDIGILSGTTAFGKTVVAIKLIAERKVNTLILVDKINLLSQWIDRLNQFLNINEILPEISVSSSNKKGRKIKTGIIGQLGAGKNTLKGVVDVAVMQSLGRTGEIKDCVKNYGMIIADECHHAPAFSYEKILKTTNARYVYGLTATPSRKDGHHPILLMQCGAVRYRDNPKKQAENRPFNHYVIPRFTSFRASFDKNDNHTSIQELYNGIIDSELRNQRIIEDVTNSYKTGKNCLVLTQRTAHVEMLSKELKKEFPDVYALTGKMGRKKEREVFDRIKNTPEDSKLILVATGPFIGEGFDEPRLDTLFLVMPVSWKGTLQQYAGRLHRLFEKKKEVLIYDYVDVHIRMLEKMYHKRQSGYASMGYKIKGDALSTNTIDIIFNRDNFFPVFSNDLYNAKKEILIVSPFIRKRRVMQMVQNIEAALDNNVHVIVVTRPIDDFKEIDRSSLKEALGLMEDRGISLVMKSQIHQKFAIIDRKIVWYGSINLLSFGGSQESIMRIENINIASELIRNIEE